MRKYLFALLVLFLPVQVWATDCTVAALGSAITAASEGDTVTCAGNFTWTGTLTITKPITLSGSSTPVITHNAGDGVPLIKIQPAEGKETSLFRVTGFYFENTESFPSKEGGTKHLTPDIYVYGKATNFRIDHNTFHFGKEAIKHSMWVNGVIDSNTFLNVDLSIRVSDDPDSPRSRPSTNAWGRTIQAGGSDMVFIENNTFTTTDIADCDSSNEYVYHYNGGRSAIRYNDFANACTEGYGMDAAIDVHGIAGSDRGTVIMELYNNSFSMSTMNKIMNLRGGSMIVHDNSLTTTSGTPGISLWNEGLWTESSCCVGWAGPDGVLFDIDSLPPTRDQLFNSFFWNNTVNGSAASVYLHGYNTAAQIRQNTEYFLHAPASSGGKYTFPTNPGSEDMTFSSSGANAYYPYGIYQCPHPTTGVSGACSPGMAGTSGYSGVDVQPPTITMTSATGDLACSADPLPYSLTATTNENATVRYCIDGVDGCSSTTSYSTMGAGANLTGAGTMSHSKSLSLACAASYTIHTRSSDTTGNVNTSPQSITVNVNNADSTKPTMSAGNAVIPVLGNKITFTFSEIVRIGSVYTGWTMTASGGAVTMTYASGVNSTALVYSLSRSIVNGETVTVTYVQPTDGIEDQNNNQFDSITAFATTNNSTYTIPSEVTSGTQNQTVWGGETPSGLTESLIDESRDGYGVVLGVKFSVSRNGRIRGVCTWKLAEEDTTGQAAKPLGRLWTALGTNLASASFTNTDNATEGRVCVSFTTPVSINPNMTYVVTVYHPPIVALNNDPVWVRRTGDFTGPIVQKYITIPAYSETSRLGMYKYTQTSTDYYDTESPSASNYFVEPIFDPEPGFTLN